MFLYQDMWRSFPPIFIEICMGTPCWCPSGWAPTWRPETNRNITEFCYKSVNLFLEELKNIKIILFQIQEFSDSQIPRNKSRSRSLFNQLGRHVNATSRKSIVYHKSKNPSGTKILACILVSSGSDTSFK